MGIAAVKTVLLVAVGLAGLRLGQPRMLSRLAPFDVLTFAAMGAAIGRSATANTTSFGEGAVVVVSLVLVHRLVSTLRRWPRFRRVVDRPVEVVVWQGKAVPDALQRTGLTMDDVNCALRHNDVESLDDVPAMLLEPTGTLTVVRREPHITRAEAPVKAVVSSLRPDGVLSPAGGEKRRTRAPS